MFGTRNTSNRFVVEWIEEMAQLCEPEHIHWCDGSEEEKRALIEQAVREKVLIKLNPKRLPDCYYHRSNRNDVARVERSTYVCTDTETEAGPTNNWAPPREMKERLYRLARRSMRGRTLYVIPYLMGPPGSTLCKVGIELSDSIYVALNMGIMTRMGNIAFEQLKDSADFNRGLHCMLDVNPERRYICHFPRENLIIAVGSAYGGNVLLGKKCLALRIGSYLGHKEGWMAEHMLILGIEAPSGEKTFVAAAFPSACGKTNLAMLVPPPQFKDWRIWTVGDDIAWMKPEADGRLYAINPETGYFGVMPGTNRKSNPNAMRTISCDTIYTNVALTSELDVWWEGKDGPKPEEAIDWQGKPWTPASEEKAAHSNSRFTAPMRNNPVLAPEVNDPGGVPISAIIFGARRATTMPLVYQAFDWVHGVYVGATIGSEMTPAAAGGVGQVRRDPMAMLPFCGYNMGDYFQHWLNIRKRLKYPPAIFHVNWFRKDKGGDYIWPGFGENVRVLKWIVDRCRGRAGAIESPLGWIPESKDIDLTGLKDFGPDKLEELLSIDPEEWRRELLMQEELFLKLYANLPKELIFQRELLISRL